MKKQYFNVILLALMSVFLLSFKSFCFSGQKEITNNIVLTDSISSDTTSQLAILKSKKWVMEGQGGYYLVYLFSDSLRTNYEDDFLLGSCEFYLSDSMDLKFDKQKIGTKNGKYIIEKMAYPYDGTNDNTIIYKIHELNSNTLYIEYMYLHDEVFAGFTDWKKFKAVDLNAPRYPFPKPDPEDDEW